MYTYTQEVKGKSSTTRLHAVNILGNVTRTLAQNVQHADRATPLGPSLMCQTEAVTEEGWWSLI